MTEETYCRLCAMKIENYIKIYGDEGEKLNLATKIIQCLQIWLYPEDVLPKTICSQCCSKVNLFFEFFQTCSQSQISLMSMYKDKDEEEKIIMNEYTEVSNENNVDHDYEDDENGETRQDCNEYTELATPEKATSKRKLRTPIRHSVPEGSTEEQVQQLDTGQSVDQSEFALPQFTTEKKDRKCKNKPRVSLTGDDEDENNLDYESEEESEPKLSGRGLEGYIWKCTTCTEELNTLAELRKHHSEIHKQAPVFACIHCTKSYTRYRSFARHVKMHSNPRKFSCDICGKSFSQKTVLQSHATVHSDERPHHCAHCGKSFKQFSSLYLHSKCHLPEQAKPKFRCTYCPKEFATKHTLETHLKMHTGERNFVCDICGKRFVAKGSLDYHILTHDDAKPHSCNVCGKGFKTARLLAKHSTLHTGVKPHQCDVCGKQFRERGALKEHNRIHTGAMPYSCDFCGKLFRFKGILTVHRRQHTGERPYSCTECRRDFTNWANYNKHMKRRHRNLEVNNGALGSRLPQPAAPPPPPQHVLLATPPAPPPTLPVTHYEPADTAYKLEEEVYRVPNYIPSMSYYMPPLQHTILQTRTQ